MLVFTLIGIQQSKTYLVETEEGEPSNEWIESPDYQLGEAVRRPDWGPPPVNGIVTRRNRGLGESSHGGQGNPPPVNRVLGESSHGDRGNPPPVNRALGDMSQPARRSPPAVDSCLFEK